MTEPPTPHNTTVSSSAQNRALPKPTWLLQKFERLLLHLLECGVPAI